MKILNGGYVMLDISDSNIYEYANGAVKAHKPVMVYDGETVAYAKRIKKVGTSVVVVANKVYEIKSTGVTSKFEDFTKIPSAVLETIECGDVLVKTTTKQEHAYRVSYKEGATGICLTYVDASLAETVSYDYTDGACVYNSTDSTPLTE